MSELKGLQMNIGKTAKHERRKIQNVAEHLREYLSNESKRRLRLKNRVIS